MTILHPRLVEQVAKGNCVLFLGPDIAESAEGHQGLPTQWQLIDELAQDCDYRGRYRSLPHMSQIYAYRRSEHELVLHLERHISRATNPLPIHEIIARIPLPVIVYAGWDTLLEQTLSHHHIATRVVVEPDDIGLNRYFNTTLYKPYGSIDRPHTLALTHEQQYRLLNQSQLLLAQLTTLLTDHWLLMVGYTFDFDSVFVQLYNQIRQSRVNRPPAFVMQSLSQPDEIAFWETLDIQPLTAESPTQFLYELAHAVAQSENRSIDLPPITSLSTADKVSITELAKHTLITNRVLETMGIGELVEESDVPLLSAEQVHNLEAMRAAYERLALDLQDVAQASSMWLRQGNIEYARQNFGQAVEYYQAAIAVQPNHAEAYFNMHYAYLALSSQLSTAGRWEDAQEKLNRAFGAYQTAIEHAPYLNLLPDEYVVEAILGQGGMGVVYQVRAKASGEKLAIKVLRRPHMYNQKAIFRFQREAEILQRLQHNSIVRFIESRSYKSRNLLIMEYLEDETLAKRLQQGPIGLDEVNQIVQQIGSALSEVHQLGIVHRDIKPGNIFLVNGSAKLIDFGLATDPASGSLSLIGVATGTILYMSPEQKLGLPVDQRSDIYSLATVFYEALSGKHPAEGTYRPLSERVEKINPDLDLVVEKARRFEPDNRYASVAEFCTDLASVTANQPASYQAKPWRRLLAAYQKVFTDLTTDYWLALPLLSLLTAYLLPSLFNQLALSTKLVLRFTGLFWWDIFLSAIFTLFLFAWLARRHDYAPLMTYGPITSTLLGVSSALFGWLIIRGTGESPINKETAGFIDLVFAWIVYGFVALLFAMLGFLGMIGLAHILERFRLRSAWAWRISFTLLLVFLGATLFFSLLAYFVGISVTEPLS